MYDNEKLIRQYLKLLDINVYYSNSSLYINTNKVLDVPVSNNRKSTTRAIIIR